MLYIMRHGLTDWNVGRKLQGRTDIPLNAEGRAMAERAAEEAVSFDVCYSSPLKRARETAEIVLGGRTPIITDDRLTEMGFGCYEGLCGGDGLPQSINTLFESPQNYIPDGGAESLESLFSRTGSFLDEVALPLSEGGKRVLIVGHGAMNASIICRIRGIPRERFWSALTENCKLIKLI